MKKAVKVAVIIVGVFVLFLIGLSIFVKIFPSGDKLRTIIIPRAEALTGRKVAFDEINVSLFKGIVAKGLSVKERDGRTDFLKAREFILSYHLLPLLKKQLDITKIEIISPSISIKRDKEGRYNFSDFTTIHTREPKGPSPSGTRGLPVSIVTDRLAVRNAHFAFVDEEKSLPGVAASFDAEFKGSIGKEGTPRLDFGRVFLRQMKATLKDTELKASGKIDMDAYTVRGTLRTQIGKDNVEITATVKDYLSVPDAIVTLHANHLDLGKLMGLGRGKKGSEGSPEKKEKKSREPEGGPFEKLKASGQITVDSAQYQDYVIKDFRLGYQFAGGTMKLEPVGLRFSGGDAFTAEGSLNGNLQFTGKEASTIEKTLTRKAVANLGKGAVKESQIFDAIALLTGIPALKNPAFDQGLFNFDVRQEKVFLDGHISSSLFKLTPKGWIDFDKRLDITTNLRISPALTGTLGRGLAAIRFIEDEQGWKIIPLKIKGTTEKPKVGLDEEALSQQLGPGLKRGLERFLEGQPADKPGKPSRKTLPESSSKSSSGSKLEIAPLDG